METIENLKSSSGRSGNQGAQCSPEAGKWVRTISSVVLLAFSLSWPAPQKSEEIEDYYKKWLEEDVTLIVTPEEKQVFLGLSTPEEKDQFIEQFWLRRDLDQTTMVNEFKEEHYRRIAYANERFHSGIPGWLTDRGRIYIRFGPPTGIEKHPTGGTYARKPEEGGGMTYTYPFEVWFYNHLDGVGDGIEIEFVDYTRTQEYRIARDPDEKDALLHVPGAGQTLGEILGTETRLSRFRTRGLGNPEGKGAATIDTSTRPLRYRDYPLQRLERLYKLQRTPEVQYKDLERIVTTRIRYAQLPFEVRTDVLRISDLRSLVPITFSIENKELTFTPHPEKSDLLVTQINLFGRIETLSGRIAYSFEDNIERRVVKQEYERDRSGFSVFQKRLPLEPGRYKLSLVLREQASGKLATLDHLIVVPKTVEHALQTSTVMLTRAVASPPDSATIADPFVIGRYKVVPTPDNRFVLEDQFVQAYFEVYNLQLDQSTQQPSVQIEISLLKGSKRVFPFQPIEQEFEFDYDRLLIYKTIPFAGLEPGAYTLDFRITDQI